VAPISSRLHPASNTTTQEGQDQSGHHINLHTETHTHTVTNIVKHAHTRTTTTTSVEAQPNFQTHSHTHTLTHSHTHTHTKQAAAIGLTWSFDKTSFPDMTTYRDDPGFTTLLDTTFLATVSYHVTCAAPVTHAGDMGPKPITPHQITNTRPAVSLQEKSQQPIQTVPQTQTGKETERFRQR
jgi:hypothetical protein